MFYTNFFPFIVVPLDAMGSQNVRSAGRNSNIFTKEDGSLTTVTYGIIGGAAGFIIIVIITSIVCVKVGSKTRRNNNRNSLASGKNETLEGAVIPNYFGLSSKTLSAYDPYNPTKG